MSRIEMLLAVREVGERVGYGALDQLTSLKPEGWEIAAAVGLGLTIGQAIHFISMETRKAKSASSLPVTDKQVKYEDSTIDIKPQGSLGPNPNP